MSKSNKAGMAFLTREQIVAAVKSGRRVKEVAVERLGGTVRLRELTAGEMFGYREAAKDKDEETAGLCLLAACWVGEDDALLFPGDDGLAALKEFPLEILTDLTNAVLEVNGLGEKAVTEAGKD